MSKPKNITESFEVVATKIDYIQRDVIEIRHKLDADYVTQDQFEPIKRIVYGMVSVILLGVMGALAALVIK